MVLQINYKSYFNYIYHKKRPEEEQKDYNLRQTKSQALSNTNIFFSFHLLAYVYQHNCPF